MTMLVPMLLWWYNDDYYDNSDDAAADFHDNGDVNAVDGATAFDDTDDFHKRLVFIRKCVRIPSN